MDNNDINTLKDKITALEKENQELKNEVESLTQYVEQLEDFLKDEAAIYADSAEEEDITQIRTYSRGKETAFQYVLENINKMKPKKDSPDKKD
jgi:wobble nucleotide-excising tRNase